MGKCISIEGKIQRAADHNGQQLDDWGMLDRERVGTRGVQVICTLHQNQLAIGPYHKS